MHLDAKEGQNTMKDRIPAKIYAKSFHAFIEKALRATQGTRLESSECYIDVIVWYLERFLRGDCKKLLVNLPGRHLKSFIFSICFPAFALGLDPTRKFLIVAYSQDIAEDIVEQVRAIMQSSWYKAAFKTRIIDGRSRANDFSVVGGGRVRAAAVRSVTGKGGDCVIFDDPHNAHDWDDERKKAKVIEALEFLMSRRNAGAKSGLLVVGHRIAVDDLSAHILERGDFEHLCMPLFAPEDMTFEIGSDSRHLAKGESLRPDAFPPEEIDSLRKNHLGPPFWLYYQQGLGPPDDFNINVAHFPFLRGGILGRQLPEDVPVILSVDCAQKTHSGSRNVIHVYAKRGDNYDFIQAFAEKCSFPRLLKKVEYFARRYNAWFVIIENTARGPDLIEHLEKKIGVPIVPVNPRGTKADRLRECASIIQAKKIRIRQLLAVEEAIDEVIAFPNSPTDDHVDAMTNFLLEEPKLWVKNQASSPGHGGAASGTRRTDHRPADGIAIARGRSIYDSTARLPDFSNGRAEPQRRPDGRSPYDAGNSPGPSFSAYGTKIVRSG
jgi:predicted phage terminase large subunit-like protein